MIEGSKREHKEGEFGKRKVGLFECRVIAVNPTVEDYKEKLGIELKEDSKATDYLGESQDGNQFLRVDMWLEAIKNNERFKATFFLENKEKENKDLTKKQYINTVGSCCWADSPNNLPKWFIEREYRVAFVGEEDFYNFLRTWLSEFNYRDPETVLQIEWKRLMKGNVKELREMIDSEWCSNIVALATIITKEKEGEIKEYQGVYTKGFLPAYSLRNFRLIDYSDPKILENLAKKKSKDLKPHERFVLNLTGEYGSKDYFILKDIQEYNPEDNIVATDKVISAENPDY
jgi:hypothetical protein